MPLFSKDDFNAVMSLAAGGVAFILAFSFWLQLENYDNHIPSHQSIFRVDLTSDSVNRAVDVSSLTAHQLGPALANANSGVTEYLRLSQVEEDFLAPQGRPPTSSATVYADQNILSFLGLELLEGEAERILADPKSIVLSRSLAEQLFGDIGGTLGRTIDTLEGEQLIVTAVVEDVPKNSHLSFTAIRSLEHKLRTSASVEVRFWVPELFTYIRIINRNDSILSSIQKLLAENTPIEYQPQLLHVSKIHFNGASVARMKPPANPLAGTVTLLAGVSVLIFSLATYASFIVTGVLGKAQTIGLIKSLGVTPLECWRILGLNGLILGTAAFVAAFSAACILVGLLEPVIGGWLSLGDLFSLVIVIGSGAIFIVATTLASLLSVRAVAYGRASNLLSVQASEHFGGRSWAFQALIGLQAVVGTIAVVIMTTSALQMSETQSPVEYVDTNNKWVADFTAFTQGRDQSNAYDNASVARKVKLVAENLVNENVLVNASVSDAVIPSPLIKQISLRPPAEAGVDALSVQRLSVDPSFLNLMDLSVISGRFFDRERSGDRFTTEQEGQPVSVVISDSAARAMGFNDPNQAIGQSVRPTGSLVGSTSAPSAMEVIGVVQDIHYQSIRQEPTPVIYVWAPELGAKIYIGSTLAKPADINSMFDRVLQQHFPGARIELVPLSELKARLLKDDRELMINFSMLTVMFILIAGTALFGLTQFLLRKQSRETAILRLAGASAFALGRDLTMKFMLPICVASLLSLPFALIISNAWLEQFPIRTGASAIQRILPVTGYLALLVAIIWTTVFTSLKQPLLGFFNDD